MKARARKSLLNRIINIDSKKNEKDKTKELELKKLASFVAIFIATYLAIVNFFSGNIILAICSCAITVAFVVCIILSSNTDNIPVINIIMTLVVAVVFTYIAFYNTKDITFNIWFLIVPAVCFEVISFKYGLILSSYFQVLLIVLFFTPLRNTFVSEANSSFATYFTLTYFASFFMSAYISFKNKVNIEEIKNSLNHDHLTGLWNKPMYDERLKQMIENEEYKDVTLYNIKVNGIMDVNDRFGRTAGDALIKFAADYIRTVFNDDVFDIYRIFSGEFVAVIDGENKSHYLEDLNRFSFIYEEVKFDSVSFTVTQTYGDKIFDEFGDTIGD